jgi:peptidoglycan/LPS O-acetylase OafA/YrhL
VERRNSFDLVRLAAACTVLASHSYSIAGLPADEPARRFTSYQSMGELALDVFFVLSGYLVAGSWTRGGGAADFVAKRAARILPALWMVVLASVFVLGPLATTLSLRGYFADPQSFGYLRTMWFDVKYDLPGVFGANPDADAVNGSLWTLPLEVTMYGLVIAMGLLRALTQRGCAAMLLAFLVLALTLPVTPLAPDNIFLGYLPWRSFTHLGMFYFAGALFSTTRTDWLRRREVLIGAAAMLALLSGTREAAIAAIVAIPCLTLGLGLIPSRLSDAVSRVGDLSYGAYILGFPVQQTLMLTGRFGGQPWLLTLAALPIALALAWLSWRFVEKPALRLGCTFGQPTRALQPA